MRIVTKEAFDLSGKQNYPSDPAPIPPFPENSFSISVSAVASII